MITVPLYGKGRADSITRLSSSFACRWNHPILLPRANSRRGNEDGKGNVRELLALELFARARLDPGPSGPFLAVRLRWPKARIIIPREDFPGARKPWTHPGDEARSVNQTCFRLFGLWGQVSSRAEQRQVKGAGESKRKKRLEYNLRSFRLFSPASLTCLYAALRAARPAKPVARERLLTYKPVGGKCCSRSGPKRRFLCPAFFSQRKRVFLPCFAEIQRFLSYFPICIMDYRTQSY